MSLDYQHLVGLPFDGKALGMGRIECVAVAPYDEAKKWLFAQYCREYEDAVKALRFYSGSEYDVVLLSRPMLRKRKILFRDLRGYLAEFNLPFAGEKYAHGQTGQHHR